MVRWGGTTWAFRIGWEDALKAGEKLAVIASDDAYVPYDLAQLMQRYDVSLGGLFPKLDTATLRAADGLDLDFLAVAYERDYVYPSDAKATRAYLETRVNVQETAERVCDELEGELVRFDERCCRLSWLDRGGAAEGTHRRDEGALRNRTEHERAHRRRIQGLRGVEVRAAHHGVCRRDSRTRELCHGVHAHAQRPVRHRGDGRHVGIRLARASRSLLRESPTRSPPPSPWCPP